MEKKISVKTTAQTQGFYIIPEKTRELADELMLLQYKDGKIHKIYHGSVSKALSKARHYPKLNRYNLGISTARKIA